MKSTKAGKKKNKAPAGESWRNRIVSHGHASPASLIANPRNWRAHPDRQQRALASVMQQVGWVQQVLVNQRTGVIIDGHLRVGLAIKTKQNEVPVDYVDLTDDEELLVLATLDPLSAMADTDGAKLDDLLRSMKVANVEELLADVRDTYGIIDAKVVGFPALPDGDRGTLRQVTFTMHVDQLERVRAAIAAAKAAGVTPGTDNENSNGNAIAAICDEYLARQ